MSDADPDQVNDLDLLIEFIRSAQQGEVSTLGDGAAFRDAIDSVLLGAPRRHTWSEFLELVSGDAESTQRIWRAVGFPRLADSDRAFTDNDLAAEQMLHSLIETGILSPERVEAVARSMAQSMARLAEWQVDLLHDVVVNRLQHLPAADSLAMVVAAIPVLEQAQSLIWRRHLNAAVLRRLPTAAAPTETRRMSVGFADMVGFTGMTRGLSPERLDLLLDHFEHVTSSAIVQHAGQVVKTVGDEVLFTVADPGIAMRIALELQEVARESAELPELRIGIATGDALARFGDVFGEPVNRAARLTAQARPGQILADAGTCLLPTEQPGIRTVSVGDLHLAGLGPVATWSVEPS